MTTKFTLITYIFISVMYDFKCSKLRYIFIYLLGYIYYIFRMAFKFTCVTIFFKTPTYKYVIFIREYNGVNINIINISIVFIV